MKGLTFTGDQQVLMTQFPMPHPDVGQVRIRTMASSICGSDMMMYRAPRAQFEEGGQGDGTSPALQKGVICGHEACGVIDELGPGVKGWKVGDRVAIHHQIGCGYCGHCLAGEPMFCAHRRPLGLVQHGSNADYSLCPASNLIRLPDVLSWEEGTFLGCQAATAYSALGKLRVSGGMTLAVYGLGPLGLIVGRMARCMGATVVGVEINPYRARLALDTDSASRVLNPAKEDCLAALMDITHDRGVQSGLVCCGADAMRRLSVLAAAVKGSIVIIGASENNMEPGADASWAFDGRHMLRKELCVRGSYVMPLGLCEEMVQFILDSHADLARLVTHRFILDEAQTAYRLFAQGLTGKVVFTYDGQQR